MKKSRKSLLILLLLLTSCNYFDFSKTNKETLFKQRIEEIKANGLELYPEIYPCGSSTGKKCFQEQLITELRDTLKIIINQKEILKNDTIWITTTVDKSGLLKLSSITKVTDSTIIKIVQNKFKTLSPIKPASINGLTVNSSYKIPLIFKPY